MQTDIVVSVIVPIYNVEKYLEKCLDSIQNQTYVNIEIILINDGSTDGCAELCKRYTDTDNRFHYFYQDNKGQGPARTAGILHANGKWITFVDPDDWLDESYVEKLLQKAEEENADITYCDFYVAKEGEQLRYNATRSLEQIARMDSCQRIEIAHNSSVWAALYKNSFWNPNKMVMPSIIYEDTVVYPILIENASKIAVVSEGLYYYRTGRTDNIMSIGRKDYRNMLRAVDYLMQIQIQNDANVEEKYKVSLYEYCRRKLANEIAILRKKGCNEELECAKTDADALLSRYFPDLHKNVEIKTMGSYISCEVYDRLVLYRNADRDNFAYTSIISIFSAEKENLQYHFKGENRYRINMVEKDIHKSCIKQIGQADYIIWDLLSECDDIIQAGDMYLTQSEAFKEYCVLNESSRIIERNSEECQKLWEKACDKLIKYIEEKGKAVFLLETYLCEGYGVMGEEGKYRNIDEIREKNKILQGYYQYIKQNYPQIKIVSISDSLLFTSATYYLGVYPWYMNHIAIYMMSADVRRHFSGE